MAIPIELLGGGSQNKLLWENQNMTAYFGNQRLGLDLKQYDGILVLAQNSVTYKQILAPSLCLKGTTSRIIAYTNGIYTRDYACDDTGVSFNSSTNTGACVPYKIYGIRL